jgi:predicted aspartyl protease
MMDQAIRKTSQRISLIVPVRLTHQGKSIVVKGVIDTGTERTIVSLGILKRLGINVEKMIAASVVRGARGTHQSFRVSLDRMEVVGECAIGPMVVTAIAELRGEMLVGMDFLRAVGAQIDFERRDVVFRCLKKAAEQKSSPGRIVLPFIFRNKKHVVTRNALVDTGATGIIIPETMSKSLGLNVVAVASRMVAIGVSLSVRRAQIDSIELKGTPCRFGPFSTSIINIPFPVIGNSFMLRAKAAIDLMKSVNEFEVTCK